MPTLPLWPLRLPVFSKVMVEKSWMRFVLAAANRWPPQLNEHCKQHTVRVEGEEVRRYRGEGRGKTEVKDNEKIKR